MYHAKLPLLRFFSVNKGICYFTGDLFQNLPKAGKNYIFEEKWHINWLKKRGRTYSVPTDLAPNSAKAGGIITGGSYNDTCVRLES